MPARSKAQQQMFGIAHAIQKGTMPASKARGPATDVAKSAKPKDVKDLASTPTKNLPQKVKKEDVQRIREYVTKVVREMLMEANRIKPQRYTMSQDEEGGDWYVWDGKTLHKSFDPDDRRTASRTLWTLRKNEGVVGNRSMTEFGRTMPKTVRPSDPAFQHQLKKARRKDRMGKVVSTVKKYTGNEQISEATTELMWLGPKRKKSYSRVTGSEAEVKVEIKRILRKLRDQGHQNPTAGAIMRRRVDARSSKDNGPWTSVRGQGLSEGKWEFEWYENGQWHTKIITGTEHMAHVMLDKIADRLIAAGDVKPPQVSVQNVE